MNHQNLRNELKNFYWNIVDSRSDEFCKECLSELDAMYRPDMSVYEMKKLQYSVITDRFDPVVFSNSPFYYETGTMSAQCDGSKEHRNNHNHAAGWTYWRRCHQFQDQNMELWKKKTVQVDEIFYLICGPYNDVNQHFVFDFKPILEMGLEGIYNKADKLLSTCRKPEEREYLDAMCTGLLCIRKIAEKFSDKAQSLLASCEDASKNLSLISRTARNVPWKKPETFYEALNTYAFLRKAIGTLEGIGINTFGRIDLDLYPFYKADIQKGAITEAEAYDLICKFLITWDMCYDHDMKMVGYSDHEMENTYVLGGYDKDGEFVFNELTAMFLRANREEEIIYPKIMVRFSEDAPGEYFDLINESILKGSSTAMYLNDDAIIPALLRAGRTTDEARNYIVSGCWGINCLGVESVDGGCYVNVLRAFEYSIHNLTDRMEKVGMCFRPIDDAKNFEEVYSITLDNIMTLLRERESITIQGGRIWDKVDTLPIYSTTMQNCMETITDYTAGGAKYRDDGYKCTGFTNVVDSLLAIKQLCFDEKKYSLGQLLDAVRNNWVGYEEVRQDALDCHGWGDGSKASCELAARFHRDLYDMTQQLTGTFGGKVLLGYLNYTEVRFWGEKTLATPDGRKSGDYISQGLTPSRLKKISCFTDVIYSMKSLDASLIGNISVMNIILPAGKLSTEACDVFLREAAHSGVQALQLNCTSKEELLDAQKHPEKYPNLIVRVSGFSAKFTSLSTEWQNEFISRTFYD
ncbi:MAG: hypothetical protein IJD36_01315 [Clostridia bacterium]|nr:hypothetical protein [Clostridia bacterium]